MENLKKENYLLHKAFEKQVRLNPGKIAVIFKDTAYTYEQVNACANYYANKLITQGIKHEEIIGIYSKFSIFAFIGILAVLKAGGAYLPINPDHPKNRIAQMLIDSKVSHILCENPCEEFLDFEILQLDTKNGIKDNPELYISDRQLAYVIYTSGSTGTPKGVMVEHNSITKHLIDYNKRLNFSISDVFLGLYNFNVDASVESIFAVLNVGGTLVICSEAEKNDVFKIYEIIKKYGVTLFAAPPVILKIINKNFDLKDTKLRIILTGGDELVSDYINKLYKEVKLMNGYGVTEACVSTLWHHVTDISRKIPIGKPLDNSKVYILDDNLQNVENGELGEIAIGGNGLARGYINDMDKTAEKFIVLNGERVYKTGDLGRILPDGSLEFLGRKDFQINLRGFRIEPSEIEVAIRKSPKIKDVYVTANDSVLVAYIVSESKNLDSNILKNHLKKYLPEYMIPAIYEFVSSIPRNDMGKVTNISLSRTSNINVTDDISLSPIQRHIRKAWSDILKIPKSIIKINSNFIELGGNSLLIMELAAYLNKKFNKKILVKDLLKAMTISKQSKLIENYTCKTEIEKTDMKRYPLSSAQKRILFMHNLKNNGIYNTVSAQIIIGKFDVEKFIASAKKVLDEYRLSHCNFESDSTAYCTVDDNKNYILTEYIDKSQENWYNQKKYIDITVKHELEHYFKLNESPLIRLKLVKISDNQFILIGNIHHILIDGISWNILFDKIKTDYNDNHFEKSYIDYLDFCVWENKNALDFNCKEALYWKKELCVLNNSSCIKDSNICFPHLDYEGDYVDTYINKSVTKSIDKIAKALHVTEFTVLLSCLEVLVSFYQSGEIGVVGVPADTRNAADLQNVPGLFINMLPIVYSFKKDSTLKDIVKNMHKKLLKCYENSAYPFEKIVKDSKVKYDISRSPIFQVMLDYCDFGKEQCLNNCEIKNIDIPCVYSKYELSLIVSKKEEKFNIRFEYCTGVFTKKFIKTFSRNYLKILDLIEKSLDRGVNDLKAILELPQKRRLDDKISDEKANIGDFEKEILNQKFKNIWQKILDTAVLDFNRNLFDMGVTSLTLVNAVTQMEDIFNVKLEVMDLFNCSNLCEVFDYLVSKIKRSFISTDEKDINTIPHNNKTKILDISQKIKKLRNKGVDSKDLVYVKLEKISEGTEYKNIICIPPLLGVSEEYHKQRFADICSNLNKNYNVYSCMYKIKEGKNFSLLDLSKAISKEIDNNLHGINYILSWCNGGYVAFEVAKFLKTKPEKLILIDTYEPKYLSSLYKDNNQSLKHEIALFVQSFMIDMDSNNTSFKSENVLNEIIDLDFQQQLKYITEKLKYLLDTDSLIKIYTRYYELYKKSMNKATGILKNFVPTNYDGDILLFYTEENEINSKSLGWESICSGNILCKPVKGNHNTMMLIPNVLSITESINKL